MIGTSAPPLTVDQAIQVIAERPGLIPVDIDLTANRLVWMDIGTARLQESYFFVSTQQFQERTPAPFRFSTDLEILDEDDLLGEVCYPTAFIYHLGRSGSTLLSKALAQIPAHLVISEAPPHFFIWPLLQAGWRALSPDDERSVRRFRNLTLALGRQRGNRYRAYFVKFTTYVVLFSDLIRAAFPTVPALFLYRHPAEVLAAMGREGPGWRRLKESDFGVLISGASRDELLHMDDLTFYAQCLARFMTAALRASSQGLSLADYRLLKPENLATFLAALNCRVEPRELELMQAQFAYHSKDDSRQRRFVPDTVAKRQSITPEIAALVWPVLDILFQRLEDAPGNLASQLV